MTIYLTPNISDDQIAAMDVFDAFRLGEELLEPTSGWAHTALGLTLDRQSRHREGALMHRMAAAMGESARDASRVQLVDRPVV